LKITRLIWLEDSVDKLARKHDVQKSEVREVFDDGPKFLFVEKGHRLGENVYAALGRSVAGRYLIIYFVYKKGGQALVLSARDMDRSERKKYEQK